MLAIKDTKSNNTQFKLLPSGDSYINYGKKEIF